MLKRIVDHHRFMRGYLWDLMIVLNRPAARFLFFLGSAFLLLGATAFYALESGANPNVQNFFDAIYFVSTTLTGVGFGDIVAITFFGRILSMVLMFGGTAMYICFTALLGAALIQVENDRPK